MSMLFRDALKVQEKCVDERVIFKALEAAMPDWIFDRDSMMIQL